MNKFRVGDRVVYCKGLLSRYKGLKATVDSLKGDESFRREPSVGITFDNGVELPGWGCYEDSLELIEDQPTLGIE